MHKTKANGFRKSWYDKWSLGRQVITGTIFKDYEQNYDLEISNFFSVFIYAIQELKSKALNRLL